MKVGDWVIHDYKIKQVMKMEGSAVTEVSCGSFRCSGRSLEVRPLDLRAKNIAESFEFYYKELNQVHGSRALNWPDINRYFCDLCIKAIDDPKRNYKEGEYNQYVLEAQDFYRKTREALISMPDVNGINLFRR